MSTYLFFLLRIGYLVQFEGEIEGEIKGEIETRIRITINTTSLLKKQIMTSSMASTTPTTWQQQSINAHQYDDSHNITITHFLL